MRHLCPGSSCSHVMSGSSLTYVFIFGAWLLGPVHGEAASEVEQLGFKEAEKRRCKSCLLKNSRKNSCRIREPQKGAEKPLMPCNKSWTMWYKKKKKKKAKSTNTILWDFPAPPTPEHPYAQTWTTHPQLVYFLPLSGNIISCPSFQLSPTFLGT